MLNHDSTTRGFIVGLLLFVFGLTLQQNAFGLSNTQLTAELQCALYPEEALGRSADDRTVRGWLRNEYRTRPSEATTLDLELSVYGPYRGRALIDGQVALHRQGERFAVSAGLLREHWGRERDSRLDILGPRNTVFSVVDPEQRLSQLTLKLSMPLGSATVELSSLLGRRAQPLPGMEGRFSFGRPVEEIVQRERMGSSALAARVLGSTPAFDWAVHLYEGLARQPVFIIAPPSATPKFHAVYDHITQVGAEAETTLDDWRLWAEGFIRRGARNVAGEEVVLRHGALAFEYQRFGAFGGSLDIIPQLRIAYDSRGEKADLPFSSSAQLGLRVANTSLRPVEVELAYLYDWTLEGKGLRASAEKLISEAPAIRAGSRLTYFEGGKTPSILDVFEQDREILFYMNLEL